VTGKEKTMNRRLIRPGVAGVVALAAILVGAAIATATIPAPDGTVHGCIKSKGQLYVIDPSGGETCGKDTALDWNKPGAGGPQGIQGPKGFTGAQGTAGSSGYERTFDQESTDGSGNGTAEADCSTGKVAVAGGYEISSSLVPLHSAPTNDGSGWVVEMTGTPNAAFTAFAICVTNGGS
jgi:hypothetical protein